MSAGEETAALSGIAIRQGPGGKRGAERPLDFRVLLGWLPVAVFYALTRIGPAWVAIGGGFLSSLVVFRLARTSGLIRFLAAFNLSILAVAGLVGIIWDSEKAYLAAGPTGDLLWPIVHLVSIRLRRPLVGVMAREMIPRLARPIPVTDRLFIALGVMWGLLDLARGIVLIWFLDNFSVGEYIVYSRVFNWPINIVLLAITLMLIARRARAVRAAASLAAASAPA